MKTFVWFVVSSIVTGMLVIFPQASFAQTDEPAKMIVATAEYASFDDAAGHAVTEVSDGDPVILYVKFPQAVKEYADKWYHGSGDVMYKDMLGFILEVGAAGDRNSAYNESKFLLKPEELEATELKINLAPGEVRPLSLNVWLKTVGSGSQGRWNSEIRLFCLTTRSGQLERQYLAVAPLTANVEASIEQYQALLQDYDARFEQGDPSFNTLPEAGKLNDPDAQKILLERLAQMKSGCAISRFYFTIDAWIVKRNALDQIEKHSAYGIVTYEEAGKAYSERVEIDRLLNGSYDVGLYSKLEITRDQL